MEVVTTHNWDDTQVTHQQLLHIRDATSFLARAKKQVSAPVQHTLAEDGAEQIAELQFCSVLLKQKPCSQLEATKKNTPPRTQATKSGSNGSLRTAVDVFYAVGAIQLDNSTRPSEVSWEATIKRTISLSTVTQHNSVTVHYLQLTAGSRRPSELVSHQADEYITRPRCLHSSPFQWLPLTPPAVLITGAPGNTPSSHRSWTKPCLCDGTDGIKKLRITHTSLTNSLQHPPKQHLTNSWLGKWPSVYSITEQLVL